MAAKKIPSTKKAAKEAQKKLQVAKDALAKRSALTKASKKEEARIANIDNPRGSSNWHYKQNLKIQAYKKQKELTNKLTEARNYAAQVTTDRSRTATRATAKAKQSKKK